MHCGVKNTGNQDIIKHGFKPAIIRLPNTPTNPVLLKLQKQRFYCKHCAQTFIASERTGGFFIYKVTDAENPYFIDYLYDPSLTNISPEGLYFVSAEDSGTGRPMLVVAHELSGTITTFDITSLLEDTDSETPVEEEPVVEVPTDVDGNEVPNGANGGQVVTTPRVTEGPYGNIVEVEEYDHVGINLAAAAQAEKDANNTLNVDIAGAILPETGSENTSIFGLIGIAIAGLGGFLVRPFKKEN
ncbi:transposase family protein [Aerococcus agrisoli]|nr:transposase family protein [Aerococcus agrisoli]